MRLAHRWLGLSTALFLAACGNDAAGPQPPPPLQITAVQPAPDDADVETGATVAVTFNQAIDPATLTPTTFRVSLNNGAQPVALRYEAATRTARAVAPLTPNATYDVVVTTGVRTPADSTLATLQLWSFATRPWHATTVDAAETVGLFTSLAQGAGGRLHVGYYDQTNGDLKYATCATGCTDGANWQAVSVDETGDVGLATSVAVDGGGRLHVGYYDFPNGDLKYATCAGSCELATNWQTVVVDAAGDVGEYISLAVDPGGAVHVAYSDNTDGDLEYATCATGCDVVDNWHTATVDAAGSVGWFTSLALGPGGQLHVSYYDLTNEDLKYATCAAGCTDGANWHAATVDAPENVGGFTSLALDAAGRVHVSYYDLTNTDLKYATCAASCDLGTNWQPVTVDPGGSVGVNTSLAVDAFGRLHVSYYLVSNADLKYATCVASCALAGNWQLSTVDFAGNVGDYTSLAVDAAGRLHVSYFDSGNGDLKYIE